MNAKKKAATNVASVGSVIMAVFPEGTNEGFYIKAYTDPNITRRNWLLTPKLPTDLFAVAAYLCKIGGVVGFFDPNPHAHTHGGVRGSEPDDHGEFHFTKDDRDVIDTCVWKWRGGKREGRSDHPDSKKRRKSTLKPPQEVDKLWKDLIDAWDKPINCGYYVHNEVGSKELPPKWWTAALSLMVIADTVAGRLFNISATSSADTLMAEHMVMAEHMKTVSEAADSEIDEKAKLPERGEEDKDSDRDHPAPRGPASLCLMADSSIVCVMPKLRIAPVGTTVRNASRNLALLPGKGEMRCQWDVTRKKLAKDEQTLNLLLIPAPFQLSARDFVALSDNLGTEDKDESKSNWENFTLRQRWLGQFNEDKLTDKPEDSDEVRAQKQSTRSEKEAERKNIQDSFIELCTGLVSSAIREARTIDGIIFPEYALNYDFFRGLCEKLKRHHKALGFVVSGSSSNCLDKRANTVLTRIWEDDDENSYLTNSRRKHHRWRLNRSQIETYGLGTVLSPKVSNWWEKSPIGQRELHFHRFRQDSVFVALICEELARSDVNHEILRAVGPNLVFALLMDSAQVPNRWPGQYASALADDPGSSVLSLTSYALVERSNRTRSNGSTSIALWKDDSGRLVTIDMPKGTGERGVLLSLRSEPVTDQTIIGKRSELRAWRYSSHCAVKPQ
ncbi:MAG: hypothetical protein INF50_00920 [Rhodobacter sp.]|nr:hypothetical protein [Rhodobacter sp.]